MAAAAPANEAAEPKADRTAELRAVLADLLAQRKEARELAGDDLSTADADVKTLMAEVESEVDTTVAEIIRMSGYPVPTTEELKADADDSATGKHKKPRSGAVPVTRPLEMCWDDGTWYSCELVGASFDYATGTVLARARVLGYGVVEAVPVARLRRFQPATGERAVVPGADCKFVHPVTGKWTPGKVERTTLKQTVWVTMTDGTADAANNSAAKGAAASDGVLPPPVTMPRSNPQQQQRSAYAVPSATPMAAVNSAPADTPGFDTATGVSAHTPGFGSGATTPGFSGTVAPTPIVRPPVTPPGGPRLVAMVGGGFRPLGVPDGAAAARARTPLFEPSREGDATARAPSTTAESETPIDVGSKLELHPCYLRCGKMYRQLTRQLSAMTEEERQEKAKEDAARKKAKANNKRRSREESLLAGAADWKEMMGRMGRPKR